MENTNSLGLLLSFARPCRRLLAASVGLAVLGVASGMVPYFAVSYMIVDLYAGTATPESLFLFALIAPLGQAWRVALGSAAVGPGVPGGVSIAAPSASQRMTRRTPVTVSLFRPSRMRS